MTTQFAYNDGTRVSREVAGVGTTYYVGNHYEIYDPVSGTTTFNKYYYFGANRVAARLFSTTPNNGTLFYMQGDHLGSSSLVMTSGGALNTRQTYYPYGAKRVFDGSALPTDYTFTGQKSDDSTGLMFYNARYYDTALGRFTQADTIVWNPFNPQSFNRYSYVNNNPVNYIDPSGHIPCKDSSDCDPGQGGDDQPGDDPNVIPEPTLTGDEYCKKYPYASGCYDPDDFPASGEDSCKRQCRDGESVSDGGYDPFLYFVHVARGNISLPIFLLPVTGNPNPRQPGSSSGPPPDFGAIIAWIWNRVLAALGVGTTACQANPTTCTKVEQKLFESVTMVNDKLNFTVTGARGLDFAKMGYNQTNAEELRQTVLSIGQKVTSADMTKITDYGTKFQRADVITGPNGVIGRIHTVWQIDQGSTVLRYITAWPEVFK